MTRGSFAAALGVFSLLADAAAEPVRAPESDDVARRLVESLAGRRLAPPPAATRSLRPDPPLSQVFQESVGGVPFLVSRDRNGTAVVLSVDPARSRAALVTSSHLVDEPFRTAEGVPFVKLLFYSPQIGGEVFEAERLERCQTERDPDAWCAALRRSLRTAVVEIVDRQRDLALLRVDEPPSGIVALPEATIDDVAPGEDVAVIGHPHGLLWTLTKGIISSVRRRYPMGSALGTVIQTQAPVGEGSSGGPLLTLHGRFLGVVSWVVPNAPGFTAAVGVDEVAAFAAGRRAERD